MNAHRRMLLEWKEDKPEEFRYRSERMLEVPTDRLLLTWLNDDYGWAGLQFSGRPDLIQKSIEEMLEHQKKSGMFFSHRSYS